MNITAIDGKQVKVLRNWSCVPLLHSGRNAKRIIKKKAEYFAMTFILPFEKCV